MDELRAWAAVANLVIAASYLGIALWAIPKIKISDSPPGYLITLVCLGVFFFTCGVTHIGLAVHVWSGEADWMIEPHHLVNHTVQALAAPVAFFLAARFLNVTISGREREAVEIIVKTKEE